MLHYKIPFMFFKFRNNSYFGEKNIVKVKTIKYATDNNFMNISPNVAFIESGSSNADNFYNDIEKSSVLYSFNNAASGLQYYNNYTSRITNYNANTFLSPATVININSYVRNGGDNILLFTHSNEQRGDYYTTLKNLYKNLVESDIITSYQKTLFNKDVKAIRAILSEDDNIRYGSDMLFDYILPYVPISTLRERTAPAVNSDTNRNRRPRPNNVSTNESGN